MSAIWAEQCKTKIMDPEHIREKVKALKAEGKSIVTLNGSFDLMHAGHLHILYEASKLGDVLIVALNSDRSIQGYKSPDRPIIPLDYRLQMMTAVAFVNYVTWFDELDPRHILHEIKPHIHVNGAEYGENCIEAEVVKAGGGQVKIIPLLTGLSTTQILHKINSLK